MTWFSIRASRLLGLIAVLIASGGAAAQFSTSADQAVVYDFETWQQLYVKNADQAMAPSSMTKIMTAYVIFQALAAGEIALEDRFRISNRAYRREGSTMWLGLDTRISVDKLLKGLIVQSGNDAAVALAEGLSGSVPDFVARMNAVAARLNMRNTRFVNPSGLVDAGAGPHNTSTANDMALLSRALIRDFPQFYPYFSETEFTFAGIRQENRNLLLGGRLRVDGIKTGYTVQGDYGQATSAFDPESGRRVVVVINGAGSIAVRKRETERLVEFGLKEFTNHEIFSPGQVVGYAPVWLGVEDRIPLIVTRRLRRTLRVDAIHNMQGTLILHNSPLNAPVVEGQEVGRLFYFSLGMSNEDAPFEEAVYAGKSVRALGPLDAALEGIRHYLLTD